MKRGALLTGVAGGITGTIASIAGIIWFIVNILSPPSLYWICVPNLDIGVIPISSAPSGALIGITILFAALLVVACILTNTSFYRMYKVDRGSMGIVALIFGISGGSVSGLLILLSLLPYGIDISLYYYGSFILVWIASFILGVSFIVMGSASIVVREYTKHSGMAIIAGILSVIGGGCLIIFAIAYIGLGLMFVAFLLWTIVFYNTEA